MKRVWCLVIIGLLLLIPSIFAADSFNNEIKKITYYAGEYETGNINYAQFLVYSNSIIGKIDEVIGTAFLNGVSEQDEIRSTLGEPSDETKTVWSNYNEEMKLDNPLPVWNKIIYDGEKIRITFDANPNYDDYNKKVIYRPGIYLELKSPEIKLDVNDKLPEIKDLAKEYSSTPNNALAQKLAQKSADLQNEFREYYDQNQGDCEAMMKQIFGSENEGEVRKVNSIEYELASNDDGSLAVTVDSCDECENPYLNIWVKIMLNNQDLKENNEFKREEYTNDQEYYLSSLKKLIEEYKSLFNEKDYQGLAKDSGELKRLNEGINQGFWNININDEDKKRIELAQQNSQDMYAGIKEQLKIMKEKKVLRQQEFKKAKQYFIDYLSGLPKKESTYTEINFKKNVYQEFKITSEGKEVCNNQKDDDNNEKVDCDDSSCQGQVCASEEVEVSEGNSTKNITKNWYCIESKCQEKKEIEIEKPVCGNGICEPQERGSCDQDCKICPEYPAIECSGKVIFSGEDENKCPLKPVCLEEKESCNSDTDCQQPLCGKAQCVENKCKVTGLEECKTEECIEGEEKLKECSSEEKIVTEKCINGLWQKTNIECENKEPIKEEIADKEVKEDIEEKRGEECNTKADCNGEDYTCSNGKCVILPQNSNKESQVVIETPKLEELDLPVDEPKQEIKEESKEQTTGGVIFQMFRTMFTPVITGKQVMDTESSDATASSNEESSDLASTNPGTSEGSTSENTQQSTENQITDNQMQTQENQPNTEEQDRLRMEEEKQRQLRQEQEDKKRLEQERMQNCKNNCNNNECSRYQVECVGKCVFDNKEQSELDSCKAKCEESTKEQTSKCQKTCYDNCMNGEGYKPDNQEFQKKEENGLYLEGYCRIDNSNSKNSKVNNAQIFFRAQGFNEYQRLLEKYSNWDGGVIWHKTEYEKLLRQRKEFENSFNQDFAVWFFEEYLPNSALDWEQASSGIDEVYNQDQKNIMEMARHASGLNMKEFPTYNLINLSYKTDYGEVDFYEEMSKAKLKFVEKEYEIPTPYMKKWIFPPKEFVISQLKFMMNNHAVPGAAKDRTERGSQGGLKEEEKQGLKQDKNFMKTIKSVSDKYNGEMNGVIQIKNKENNEVVFNLFVKVNENDIFKIEPMPVEEVPKQDVKLTLDFDKLYSFMYTVQKEVEANNLRTPEWGKSQGIGKTVTQVVDGMKIVFKVMDFLNSAEVEPKSARKDINALTKTFIWTMLKHSGDNNQDKAEVKEASPEIKK